jgi:hypothetical protein
LYKIYTQKRFSHKLRYPNGKLSDICLIDPSFNIESITMHLSYDIKSYFIILSKTTLLVLFNYLTSHIPNLISFKNDFVYYELVLVNFIRKNLDQEKKNFILKK